MAIADLDRVWLLVEVFERQAAWVKAGQRAEVVLDYLPGERGWAPLITYTPSWIPRPARSRYACASTTRMKCLRPNMFARVTILGTETAPVVHVPQEALIRGGAVNRVVLALGDGRFRAQPVKVGMEAGDRIEIRSGVSAGDQIVTSGQFLIDSESNIETALARMEETTEAPATSVRVAAVVRGIDADELTLRLEHAAIPEWSWPAMTMGFSVADADLLDGVSDGESVEVAIEKHGDDHFVVTDIATDSTTDHSGHGNASDEPLMEDDDNAMDAPVDHSGHDMAPTTDHEQHNMESGQ